MANGDFIRQASREAFGSGTARFRGRSGMISVVAGYELQGLMRNPNGTLNFVQQDFAKAHALLATELAQTTADVMQAGLKRPAVSTRRLYQAMLDPRNRASDQFGYGVGNPRWLDRSQAKYWRQIDQGYTGHVGRVIQGVWGSTLTGEWRSPASGGPPYPIAGPTYSGFGGGSGQRLRPMGRKYAYRTLRQRLGRTLGSGTGQMGTRGVIRRPILPERYFKRGWEEFNARRRTEEVARQVLTKAFGGEGVPTKALVAFQAGRGPLPPPSKQFRR